MVVSGWGKPCFPHQPPSSRVRHRKPHLASRRAKPASGRGALGFPSASSSRAYRPSPRRRRQGRGQDEQREHHRCLQQAAALSVAQATDADPAEDQRDDGEEGAGVGDDEADDEPRGIVDSFGEVVPHGLRVDPLRADPHDDVPGQRDERAASSSRAEGTVPRLARKRVRSRPSGARRRGPSRRGRARRAGSSRRRDGSSRGGLMRPASRS